MKTRLQMLVVLGLCGCAGAEGTGSRPYAVELGPAPKAHEFMAAKELRNYLDRVAENGIVTVGGEDGVVFHVGDTAFARKKGLSASTLKDEEWVVRSYGRDVVLAGGGTRGTLYAVYHFLEDECGIHWWLDNDEDVPAPSRLSFARIDRTGRPFFRCRDIYRGEPVQGVGSHPLTAVRNRLNGNGDYRIPPEYGGGFEYGPPYHCHTWDRYLPFAEHGKAHPEWYALVDGCRTGGLDVAQMCLTCPGLADVMADRVRASIRRGRAEAKWHDAPAPAIYDVSMNDATRFCECDRCRAETARYGHSGRQLRFVNRVAELAGREAPGTYFSTLAYHYSEGVPSNGVRAADNVVVKLCNTRQNMAASVFAPENRFMYDQVRAWSQYARNLFVWEYGIVFKENHVKDFPNLIGFPFPNEFHLVEKYRFYAENNVQGFLIEHEVQERSDMYALKFYLERQALENPFQDGERLLNDFMRLYYGAAGAKVLEARRRLAELFRKNKAFIAWFPRLENFDFVTDAEIDRLSALFDEAAKAVAGDERRVWRVEEARKSLLRIREVRKEQEKLKGKDERK